MKQNISKGKVKLSSGLGRTLAVSFLMFALIPMILISWISYQTAYKSLIEETQTALKTAALLKTREIHTYFKVMLADLQHQADTYPNIRLLESLINTYKASGKPLETFIKSYSRSIIIDEFASDIIKFRKAYNYHDIFLINASGDILYTVAGENDLGTNLFTGKYSSSKFAAAVRNSVETGKLSFSDYEKYNPSGNLVFGFLVYPVLNLDGDGIGAMAFQFPIDHINTIMQESTGLGQTAETYLVGPDLTLRSQSVLDKEKKLINEKILTNQTKLLKQQLDEKIAIKDMEHDAFIYEGPHGSTVLGIHNDFQIQDVNFGVIAEISEKEAFSRVIELRRTMIVMVFLTVLAVSVFTIILVRRIVRPLLFLTSGAKRVEKGNYSQPIEIHSENEIGHLADSFNTMVEALKKNRAESKKRDVQTSSLLQLTALIRREQNIKELSENITAFLCKYTNAHVGALYLVDHEKKILTFTGSFPQKTSEKVYDDIKFNQGRCGQVLRDKKAVVYTGQPADYLKIETSMGSAHPANILIFPVLLENTVLAILEIGSFENFSNMHVEFFTSANDTLANAITLSISRDRINNLLQDTQKQSHELELQAKNLKKAKTEADKSRTEAIAASSVYGNNG